MQDPLSGDLYRHQKPCTQNLLVEPPDYRLLGGRKRNIFLLDWAYFYDSTLPEIWRGYKVSLIPSIRYKP